MNQKTKIILADDHVLLRKALATLIDSFDDCKVLSEVNNGKELFISLSKVETPDIVILDLNMPEMDGYQCAIKLKNEFPNVSVLILSMFDSELTLIRLLQAGVKGFLRKDIDPAELKFAISSVIQSGYYYSTQTAGRLANLFRSGNKENLRLQNAMLTDQEIQFLKLACTDLTYKEVAQQMSLSPRSVDALRDQLFIKLDVKSRVGLAMLAIKNGVLNLGD